MFRLTLVFLLAFAPLFAKDQIITQPCGCPEQDYCCDPDENRRALPGPIAGVVTSMKCCPGLWTISAAAIAVGVLAFVLSDSSSSSTHSHN